MGNVKLLNAALIYRSLLPAFEQHTVPASTEYMMRSVYTQVRALGPPHCASWVGSYRNSVDTPHEADSITEERKMLALFQPQFLPTALLNNLEHILTPLKLAARAQQSFLKSHIPPQLEVKNVLFFFIRQSKYSLELLFCHRIQDRRKCSGGFFYSTVKHTKLVSTVLLLSVSWINNWEWDSKPLSSGWVQTVSVQTVESDSSAFPPFLAPATPWTFLNFFRKRQRLGKEVKTKS